MGKPPGPRPPDLAELVRAEDRLSFLYAEHAIISRDANAITITDADGTVHVPAATLGTLLLGPGTNVTHQGIVTLAESGATVVWVGERGVRYYGHGRGLTLSSRLIEAQARVFANQSLRLKAARFMYEMRFPGEDVSGLTMQQLRGREGARVRNVYREHSRRTGVPWKRREYQPGDFEGSDPINMALSASHTALYGVVHSVIVALGCSPALGIVHTGEVRSFVYDIADLYKAEISIPAAFDVVARGDSDDIERDVRRAVRDALVDGSIMKRCTKDIKAVLAHALSMPPDGGATGFDSEESDDAAGYDLDPRSHGVVKLWDGGDRAVESGTNYSDGFGDESRGSTGESRGNLAAADLPIHQDAGDRRGAASPREGDGRIGSSSTEPADAFDLGSLFGLDEDRE